MWYCFNKMYDGTCEAEFDEAWRQGGEHNDVGAIRARFFEAKFDLPCDEFLGNVVTPAHAAHFGSPLRNRKERRG